MQSQREFFGSVLADHGKPCLAWLVKSGDKKWFKHKVFENTDLFCEYIGKTDLSKCDYYFCISTLRDFSLDQGGKQRVRVQKNMLFTRCFVLDVDIRDKEGYYTNIEDALSGVQQVCEGLSLPQPTIVNSGFGLHVYWAMAGGVDSAKWTLAACKFKAAVATLAPQLVADGSRVADSAGVLRIPNSFNLKSTPPTPVEVIQVYDDFVDFREFSSILDRIVPGGHNGTEKTVELGQVFIDTGPVELKNVSKKCNWVGQYLKNKSTASEPEWYAILGLAKYLQHTNKEGAVATESSVAQILSKGHKDYDPEQTYNKYIQVTGAQTGPTTCAKFQAIDPKRCEGCPFYNIVKTPIQTARLDTPATKAHTIETTVIDEEGNKATETVTIPLPPTPYFRGESGGVYIRAKVKTEDGFEDVIQKVYDYDFYPTKRLRTEITESEAMECHLWLPHDGLKKFRLPSGHLADGKKLTQFLSDKGVVPEFNAGQQVNKYLVNYVRYLQMQNAAEIEFGRFGWRDIYSADPKFIVADGYVQKDGETVQSGISPYLKDAAVNVATHGELEKWKKAFDVYKDIDNSDPYILAAMLGFAAPLMPLTGYSGVMYNIVGDSAAGKSTALKVMTSVWGKPNEGQLRVEDNDIPMFNFIGYLSNIPIAFDEVTKMDGDRLSTFVLAFTGGRGKMRATQTGQNRANEAYWDTIVCSTSNVSLYDKLANARRGYTAEAMRVFELHSDPSEKINKDKIDAAISVLQENYGYAGREYIKYILPRIEKLKPIIAKATQAIAKKANLRNEERFWGALLACAIIGGKIARDTLHLHSYKIEEVIDRIIGAAPKVRQSVEVTISDPASTLAEFINANLTSLIRTNNGQLDISSMNGAMHSVKGRLEYEDGKPKTGYISIQALREYCDQRRIDNAWLRRELIEQGIIRQENTQKRLTSGTKLPQVNVKVWTVALDHKALTEQMDETVQSTD